jgi:hypothetical protein
MTRKLKAVKGRPVVIKNIINRAAHDLSGNTLIKAQCSDTNQNTCHDTADCGITRSWCKIVNKILFTKHSSLFICLFFNYLFAVYLTTLLVAVNGRIIE